MGIDRMKAEWLWNEVGAILEKTRWDGTVRFRMIFWGIVIGQYFFGVCRSRDEVNTDVSDGAQGGPACQQ